MSGLTVIVPSRGRPHTVHELVDAFQQTCSRADTRIVFAVDADDPLQPMYSTQVIGAPQASVAVVHAQPATMVTALNAVALGLLQQGVGLDGIADPEPPDAIGFMGDDHRPRTSGWDDAYLTALTGLPGIVYGNDLIQGPNLPTQCAISTPVVAALGHMAPPVLTHLYVDNYWRDLGRSAGCLTYLPEVIVEHMHPVAGKAEWDDGYHRVNARDMYRRDQRAYQLYMAGNLPEEVLKLRTARMSRAAG